MNRKKLKIGVMGTANIAIRSMIPSIKELKDHFILTSIASRSKEKADRYARELNISPYYSYMDLIEGSGIDAVYIPLPNPLHAEWIEKALRNGIHVLVEKSLACTLEEVKKLNLLAESKNLVLIENFQFRFHPQLNVILDLLEKGEIGELRYIRSSFEFPPFKDIDNIRYNKNLGGGALLDAGAYPIKISQIILGNDIKVVASSLKVDKKIGVDIWGGGFMKQNSGSIFSQFTFGFDNFYRCNIELFGSEGKLSTHRVFTAPKDYNSEIILENNLGIETVQVEASNHFVTSLLFFFKNVYSSDLRGKEYIQNINQARLLEEFKSKVHEK